MNRSVILIGIILGLLTILVAAVLIISELNRDNWEVSKGLELDKTLANAAMLEETNELKAQNIYDGIVQEAACHTITLDIVKGYVAEAKKRRDTLDEKAKAIVERKREIEAEANVSFAGNNPTMGELHDLLVPVGFLADMYGTNMAWKRGTDAIFFEVKGSGDGQFYRELTVLTLFRSGKQVWSSHAIRLKDKSIYVQDEEQRWVQVFDGNTGSFIAGSDAFGTQVKTPASKSEISSAEKLSGHEYDTPVAKIAKDLEDKIVTQYAEKKGISKTEALRQLESTPEAQRVAELDRRREDLKARMDHLVERAQISGMTPELKAEWDNIKMEAQKLKEDYSR